MSTAHDFLRDATARLGAAGIESARLDSLILLEDELEQDRAKLLAHPETTLSSAQKAALDKKIMQRATHMPLAYIRGKSSFYGRDFVVNQAVLIPRPESEAVITLLKNVPPPLHSARPVRLLDVGTGSGCLGITAELELPYATEVCLSDISQDALDIAAKNACTLDALCAYNKADLLASAKSKHYDVILANLPYVPETLAINEAATYEPSIAIFSGSDGLNHFRKFWNQVAALKRPPSYIFTESLLTQHTDLETLANKAGYKVHQIDGLVHCFTLELH